MVMLPSLAFGARMGGMANVPIVCYHSVADVNDEWQFRCLSCPTSIFESHLQALQRANFRTISLHALYKYMTEGKAIPPRSVVLTFDDGYLDNWVYVYPLLKQYGYCATIFVSPDFVDPATSLRPNLEDVWSGRVSRQDLPTSGFLSWQEMREMERSGCVDIQSHGLTHTWYSCSAHIVDFHHPGDTYPWLAWNARPERKYLWMTEDQHGFVPWGMPVYQNEKSLATRRYFPDRDLDTVLVEYVRNHGGEAVFQHVGWHQQLQQVAAEYRQRYGDFSRFETDAEYRARLHDELAGSKQIIEQHLDKSVEFLCWPGGGYNDISVDVCRESGYLASAHSSWDLSVAKNQPGADPSHLSRIAPPTFQWSGTEYEYKGGLHLICLINRVRGSYLFTAAYKALRVPFRLVQWSRQPRKGTQLFQRSLSALLRFIGLWRPESRIIARCHTNEPTGA